jgi:hypothetical protein
LPYPFVSQPSSGAGAAGCEQFIHKCDESTTQLELHTPPEQDKVTTFVALQTRLHAPQFALSVRTLISQPSDGEPLQSAKPALQPPMTHWPLDVSQTPMALGTAQSMLLQHDVVGMQALPQTLPVAHVNPQTLPAQVAVAPAGGEQSAGVQHPVFGMHAFPHAL